MKRLVVALGGNALIYRKGDFIEQMEVARNIMGHLTKLVSNGNKIVITHGNGPQVGNILLQQECAKAKVKPMPLSVCGAMSQGQIGYIIQTALIDALEKVGLRKNVATIITRVIVSKKDKAFKNPTKPIGPYYRKKIKNSVYIQGKGWRKVVPSPKPIEIVEGKVIKELVEKGVIPIACGGGGIPVIRIGKKLVGVDAVIDKDLASGLLAKTIGADTFLIITDVDKVYLNYGKKDQEGIDEMSCKEAKKYLFEGQFGLGSMGPKIEAAIKFLKNGGKKVIITMPDKVNEGIEGSAGTIVRA
ncbi:MAG: carbamate kinase [Candidatus Thermoplasmatota archaeon]